MWPLGLFSVATLFFIIRNTLLLRPKNLLRADLKPEIDSLLAQRDLKGVREICQNNPSLMTSVLDAGLERISEHDFDPVHVMEAVEEAGNEQMVTFMKPINYLSIIGGTAPMLGLLGTVSGMIKAFQTIAAGGMGKPELLAGNIGEALITTAAGLIIAIPAMISYFIFKNNFIKHMSTMGRMVGHFMNVYRNTEEDR
jgi:biopolymer transport protein ExbB